MSRTTQEIEQLFEDNIKLVYKTVYSYYNSPRFMQAHSITQDELIQSGLIGLHRACKEFDPSKGSKFSAFAINHIRWSIQTETKREGINNKKWSTDLLGHTHFEKPLESNSSVVETLHDILPDHKEESKFEELLKAVLEQIKLKYTYSEKLCSIIYLRASGFTNAQIGDILGVSRQSVDASWKRLKNDEELRDLIVA